MPREPAHLAPSSLEIEAWLAELGIEPIERIEREGLTSWDVRLDARRRFDIRGTVILDPGLAVIVWIHYAPPINDSFRASYQKLLRWNEEYAFVKFALSEDGRPTLSTELPIGTVDVDALGLAVARLLAVCDTLLDESAAWIWGAHRMPPRGERVSRQLGLFVRFADRLGDLVPAP